MREEINIARKGSACIAILHIFAKKYRKTYAAKDHTQIRDVETSLRMSKVRKGIM